MTQPQTNRFPSAWRQLRTGEMMHSKLPLHRLHAAKEQLQAIGITVEFEPTPTGYFIVCKSRTEAA